MQPTVIIPVYNAAEALGRCLESLAQWPGVPVVLVDDASTDARVAPMLARFAAARAGVTLVTAPVNRGFIATANAGASVADARSDLLFLNADTEVTGSALEEMASALGQRADAAVCCPLSNNATFLSIPRYQQEAPLPPGIDSEAMARLLREEASGMEPLTLPTAVGFCMWVRRAAWGSLGPFDAAYGRGYAEDDDFAQRVRASGGAVVCAPRAFVHHHGHASFGVTATIGEQRRSNAALLATRWPRYRDEVSAFCRSNPLRPLHERLWNRVLSWPGRRERHVMHVVKSWPGAKGQALIAAMRKETASANHTIVVAAPDTDAWVDAIDGPVEPGVRIVGLPHFAERFAAFVDASPATEVHFHDGLGDVAGAAAHAAARARPVTRE